MNVMMYNIIIPVIFRDYSFLKTTIKYIHKYLLPKKIYIITDIRFKRFLPNDILLDKSCIVLDENNSYVPYLKNPCLLESIKNNNLNYTNNNKSYIKYYSSSNNFINLEEKGKYFIAVSASIKGKIPLIYIYDKIIYDSSLIPPEPEPEPDDDDKKDEDKDNGGNDNIIFLAISLPLSTIIVLILLIALVKSKKEPLIELQPKESLIKDTSQSFE